MSGTTMFERLAGSTSMVTLLKRSNEPRVEPPAAGGNGDAGRGGAGSPGSGTAGGGGPHGGSTPQPASGQVRACPSKYGLDNEALEAAKKWRFAPGSRLGVPVPLLILAHKIGRAVFYMLSRDTVFSLEKFMAA